MIEFLSFVKFKLVRNQIDKSSLYHNTLFYGASRKGFAHVGQLFCLCFQRFVCQLVHKGGAYDDFTVDLYGVFRFVQNERVRIFFGIILLENRFLVADLLSQLFRKVGGAGGKKL